jgi:hypothetical protein
MKSRKPVYIPEVEQIYRVWIEWDIRSEHHGDPDRSTVSEAVERLKCPKTVDISDAGGGPCWNYFYIISGPRRDSVEKFARKVLRCMSRYKSIKIYSGAHQLKQ